MFFASLYSEASLSELMKKKTNEGKTAIQLAAVKKHYRILAQIFSEEYIHTKEAVEIMNVETIFTVAEGGHEGIKAVVNVLKAAAKLDEADKEADNKVSNMVEYLSKTDEGDRTLLHAT